MADLKQAPTGLDALLPLLLAQNSSSSQTQTSTANTAPLQGVYDRASAPMDSKIYADLIASIMQQGAQQVPTLTAALANATGSRSSTNSPLALALNQQNNQSAQAAAAAILAQQNQQAQTALQAANGIAGATKTVNTSGANKAGGNVDPMTGLLGGFLLNQADKRGWMDKAGNAVSSGFESMFNTNTASVPAWGDLFSGANTSTLDGVGAASDGFQFTMPSMDFGFSDVASNLGNFTDYLPDLGGVGDFVSNIGSSIGSFFGFADGGPIQTAGGKGIMGSRTHAIDAAEGAAVAGQDPNEAIRAVLQAALTPQPHQPIAMDPSILGFVQYLMNAGPGIRRNMYETPKQPNPNLAYADGGVIRNFNNMGGPRTRYGMGSMNYDGSTPNVGSSGGTTSNALIDMADRMSRSEERGGGGSSENRSYTGGASDQYFADLKATRDVFGGFAPGELSTMGKLAMFGLNPSIFGLLKLGYDGYKNGEITQNAIDFTKSLYATPEQQAALDAQALANEDYAIEQMGGTPSSGKSGWSPQYGWGTPDAPNFSDRGPGGSTGTTGETAPSGSENTGAFAGVGAAYGGSGVDSNYSGGVGFADGGLLQGPGTGTSDSIRAKNRQPGGADVWFSDNEFVIPADVVSVPGMKEHFQYLINAYHKPVRR